MPPKASLSSANMPDLHAHSGYSIYDGFGTPKSIVERAVELGWPAVALTEHGTMASAPHLYAEARKAKVKPIIGVELYVCPDEMLVDGDKDVMQETRHLTVLALSFEGYQNLVRWSTSSMQRPNFYGKPRMSLERMAEVAEHGLHHNVVLSGCLGGELCQCLLHANGNALDLGRMYLQSARDIFPNFYVEVQNQGIRKFLEAGLTNYQKMVDDQNEVNDKLLSLARELDIPVIVTNDSHYQHPRQRKPHMAMLARKQWRRVAESHEGKVGQSTVDEFAAAYGYYGAYLRSMEEIADTLPEWARRQSVESIRDIVEEADVRLDPLDKFQYALPVSPYQDPVDEVRRRCKSRLKSMVERHGDKAAERFEYELGAMKEFAHYLLIYADIIKMARSQGIYTWTRGSGCASLVAYCLRIHEIDPIHYDLLFERFVNPARAKFPDIDIDIEAHRRDDVAKMVREYMSEIGQDVMAICTYGTVSNRNAFRMMAEAYGVDKEKIDELAKLLPQMIDSGMVNSDEEAYELLKDELGLDIHDDAAAVFDTIGTISQHACAFVIGTKDRPLSSWVPEHRIASSDAVVTQYNMKWIENMGFLKLDLLRLDTLSILHSVARQLGEGIDWIDKLGQKEPGIYEMTPEALQRLCEGRTDGIFTFQGSTQRRGCVEVQPETVEDLIAIQALYRPGATRTGNDKKFVSRRRGEEDWTDLNDFTAKRWHETYGIPIYQEQIMELGFDLGMSGEEVDDLYKAIKLAKGVGRGAAEAFANFEPTFRKTVDGKMPQDEADIMWAEFDRMQGYSFNRAHATSFGVLGGPKSATCMAEHPLETYIAILERYPDNPRYIAAAIADGFRFELPDVNQGSSSFAKGSDDKSIRVGLLRVNGIGPGAAGELVRNQPFRSIEDIKERTNSQRVKSTTIEALRAIGALECLGVKGDADDLTQLNLLDMVVGRPKAFKGCTPSLRKHANSSWEFLGLERGLTLTFGKCFCAKSFWVPPGTSVSLEAAPNGHYSSYLMPVVDENGLVFDLLVRDNKEHEAELLKILASLQGCVVCLEGQVGLPFLRGGSTTFKVWGVAGAEIENPQVWHVSEDDALRIIRNARAKMDERRRAA